MREHGFYWVNQEGEWEIAHWNGEVWSFVGCDSYFKESELIEIDERKIERKP